MTALLRVMLVALAVHSASTAEGIKMMFAPTPCMFLPGNPVWIARQAAGLPGGAPPGQLYCRTAPRGGALSRWLSANGDTGSGGEGGTDLEFETWYARTKRAADPGVHACGDVVEHKGRRWRIVSPGYQVCAPTHPPTHPRSNPLTHPRTHAPTRARAHTHTHTHTRARARACAHNRTMSYARVSVRLCLFILLFSSL
jgi:hypothetical protein